MELTDTVEPWVVDPPDEPCGGADAAPVFSLVAPAQFAEAPIAGLPSAEGRLISGLREAAATGSAMDILERATEAFWRARFQVPGLSGGAAFATALADLSVSGRRAYRDWPVDQTVLAARARARCPAQATAADVGAAMKRAIDRALEVAWALRGPAALRAAERPPLSWIAVSAEDDTPHRPVNQPSPKIGGVELEQYEIPVTADGITVRTRFLIASAVPDSPPAVVFYRRALPPDPVPTIPGDHEVILFLHGHSSSAEEALPIIPHLFAAGLARGRKYSIVSLDLPNSGYSETFDHEKEIPSATTFPADPGSNQLVRTPVLDFTENFVVAFVNALDAVTPVKSRFAGVIGGSLGGNLGLRLGRRPDAEANRWLSAGIVSWSPASVWDPMAKNFFKSVGPGKALERAYESESLRSRADYFFNAYDFVLPFVDRKSPNLWYSPDWHPCDAFHIDASRRARQEIYSPNFRRWHWRLACDQLVYSHVDRYVRTDPNSRIRYQDNTVRQLLVAGAHDDFQFSNIFPATQKLAKKMVATPGRSLFLAKTGHSIHVERPRYFAGEIVRFLAEVPRAAPDLSFLEPLLLNDPMPAPPDLSFVPLLLSGPVV